MKKPRYAWLLQLLLLLLFPGWLMAQVKDYSVLLKSGKFTPAENGSTVSKSSPVLQKSLFKDKHYVVLQFNSLPDQAMKDQLQAAGIQLLDYIPNLSYTAAVNSSFNPSLFSNFSVRSLFTLDAAQKTFSDVLNGKAPAHAVKIEGTADMEILLYENLSAEKIGAALGELQASIINYLPVFRSYVIRVPLKNIPQVASLPFVQWTEFIGPPVVPENLPGRVTHRANVLNDGVRNLKGDGMNVGVWDDVVSPHLDFSPAGRLVQVDATTPDFHGTHVAGTIAGRGLINPTARGMAPNTRIYSYDGYNGAHVTLNLAEMAVVVPANSLIASNHSYHDGLGVQCTLGGAATSYSLWSRNGDINSNNNTFHLHCQSAGNAQGSCANGWFTITGSGKSAKNNVVVGNVTAADVMSGSSSWGPVNDGRVKPDICAVGESVFSTFTPLNTYNTISGTSMATPGIAGTLTLLAQRYKQLNADVLPPSMLIKNIACNTAVDLGNPGPDYRFGFGRINALPAVRILEENRYRLSTIATGAQNDETITVPAGATRLRVMLTWNDPAGTANAAVPLVNNLDLRVIEGANTFLPWILNPNNPAANATTGDDNISNVEQITILNPPAGTYTLRVIGEAIPTGPNQAYALTWDVEQPYIEVTYPNGGETLNPGTTQAITWNSSGVTGNQTVEYSLDNGGAWTTISSTVASGTTRLNWTVPAANTSTALVRVTSGALSDVSDANFKILGTVTGFTGSGASCSSGEVIFTWNAVTNATHYDIYRLDPATGAFVVLASNVTGTTHTATGLTPATSMWFTIRAKNNTTSAESERANAINVTVSSGGGGLGPVGPITGQNAICGTPNGVAYSVPTVAGATTYTWTAPPGATIASGQGTNSITINYVAGSTSGNVSVTASAGACVTPPANLAVSVNTTPVAAPVSGGNQTTTECPPTPIPTLTATATVPAGHTITWYSAATGGTVVASPTLNTVGTVTYHAESRHTASGCISPSRTAVTLTINPAVPASITAGGPTTFCSGGSVVLTANSGSSYNWSNGATTQSITVTTGGSYTVVVTQTGGCTGTSAPTVVTVNPSPAATITAGGPTGFCQGGSVVLTASAGSSWLWSNGATTQSITVSTAGAYTVRVTGANGCSTLTPTATNVNVSPLPAVSISATNPPLLLPTQTTSLVLTANPTGGTVVWQKNGTAIAGATGATLANLGVDDAGTYRVLYTSGGCANTSNEIVVGAQASSNFYVAPNPNQGTFWVRYFNQTNEKVTLTVYDAKGVIVYQRASLTTLPYSRIDVNLGLVGSGSYLVVLHGSNGKQLGAKQIWVGAR